MSSNSLNEILSDQLQRIKTCLKENNIEELDYSQFSDHKIVGTGGSAIVCSAIAQKKIYALKILNVNQCLPEKNFLKLLRELEILSNIHHSNIRHPNIIELYGVLIDPSGNPIMVLQFANGGSLREHLHAKQNDGLYKISWTELIQIANDIAKGLKHLHSNGIIHRYLHSKNILLNDGRALISDFGISREFKEFSNTSSSSKMQGMITYTDPQYLLHGKKFKRNEKSDIYSLGMLLWELTSGIPPFHNLTIVEIVLKIKYHCVENVINNTPQDYANLYKKCWSSDPEQRPTPNEISAVLDTLFGEITVEFITNCIGNTLCDTSSDTTATFSEVSNCGTATLSKIPNYSISKLPDRIKINIFSYVRFPKNLLLSCKVWHQLSQKNDVRARWIIVNFGKAHALFHAIRFGPEFINVPVVQRIIEMGGILSRYFIQRFLLAFGPDDPKLIEMEFCFNEGNINAEQTRRVQKRHGVPWGSNTPTEVFAFLLNNESICADLAFKGNDMELFHFLSGGPRVINQAIKRLEGNLDIINELITKSKFIPFPPRPKNWHEDKSVEEYPAKDGYENNRQLKIIARAILIHKNLINLWKKIGYHDIIDDVNDLVIQGALLLLFSSTWKNNKVPTVGEIAYKLQELLTFGFKPTYSAIIDILQVFKYKLSYIGEKIISAFFIFCENERRDEFYKQIVIETIKAERSIKMFEVWNFLDEKFGSKSATIFICAMKQFKERNLSCAINGIKAFNTIEHYSRSTFNAFDYKPLLFSRPFYTWILIKFTEDSEIAYFAFNDILETRISFDLNTVSCRIFKTKFNESCNIFKIYCNVKNFFQISHLELLKKVSDKDILCSLFEFYLPKLFGLPTNFRMPIQGTDDSNIDFKPKKKMKKRTGDEKLEWLTAIKDIHNGIVEEDDTKTSAIFRNCINVLYHKLEEEGKL